MIDMDRRGELTSHQLVLLILTVLGFALILLFLFGLQGLFSTEDEFCRLSVLKRATAQEAAGAAGKGVAAAFIPLQCQTKKVCVTAGGDCEGSFAGEEPEQVRVKSGEIQDGKETKPSVQHTVEQTLSEEFFRCWQMMGQGKLDLFGAGSAEFGLSQDKNVCVICSRIALDEGLTDAGSRFRPGVEKVDVEKYMKEHVVPGTEESYWEYFKDVHTATYVGVRTDEGQKNLEDGLDETKKEELQVQNDGPVEVAIVFSQIKTQDYGDVFTRLGKAGLLIGGASAVTAPGTTLKVLSRALLTKAGLIVAIPVAAAGSYFVWSNVRAGKSTAAARCGAFTSQADAEASGCSLVQLVPYTVENINSLCQQLEGAP